MYKDKKILVVDDEEKILQVVKLYLENEGYLVCVSTNGRDAYVIFEKEKPDLIILDLMLPDLTGEEICKRIREKSSVPIIMLTAKSEESNILSGFDIGADDYVVKPFSVKQLIARVKAVLRRSEDILNNRLTFNDAELIIDSETIEVYKDGKLVPLTPIEFKILSLLSQYPNKVFSRDDIIKHIYLDDFDGYDRAIDSHIKNIRKKINDSPPKYIITVHGIGYKFGGKS